MCSQVLIILMNFTSYQWGVAWISVERGQNGDNFNKPSKNLNKNSTFLPVAPWLKKIDLEKNDFW